MDQSTLDTLGVFAQFATPVVVAIAGFFINRNLDRSQRREERLRDLEAKLRDERIAAYNTIIEPYIVILASEKGFASLPEYRKYRGKSTTKEEVAIELMGSVQYKRAVIQLVTFGSDTVVRAFNRMMKHSFQSSTIGGDPHEMMLLLGDFLLEIRKNVGNESTTLSQIEMFEGYLKDSEKLQSAGNGKSL